LLVCVVAAFVAARGISRELSNRRLVHAQNMAKAEQFKHEFDATVPKGTTLAAVEDYLKTQGVNVQQSLGLRDGRTFVQELMIEVVTERSINWYCGTASVGLVARFDSNRLVSSSVSSWSFDCP
jgi:hypothetical protein